MGRCIQRGLPREETPAFGQKKKEAAIGLACRRQCTTITVRRAASSEHPARAARWLGLAWPPSSPESISTNPALCAPPPTIQHRGNNLGNANRAAGPTTSFQTNCPSQERPCCASLPPTALFYFIPNSVSCRAREDSRVATKQLTRPPVGSKAEIANGCARWRKHRSPRRETPLQQQQRPKTTAFLVASFSTFEIPTLAELRPPAFSSHDAPLSWPFSSRALPPPSQLWLHGAGTGCSSGQQASTLPGLSASDPEPRLILCPPAAGGCRASYLVSGAADSRNSPWTSVLGVALTFAGSRPLCSLTGARAGMADGRARSLWETGVVVPVLLDVVSGRFMTLAPRNCQPPENALLTRHLRTTKMESAQSSSPRLGAKSSGWTGWLSRIGLLTAVTVSRTGFNFSELSANTSDEQLSVIWSHSEIPLADWSRMRLRKVTVHT
ncbi:hypothetical protein Purlil1_170 [Purpureocillium lilacinum]|uniref:Uncharacterized protein n=1 Tax=Purpureocillium lilacinum TaxID=33203 RepID=A0ABR0CGE8_PURLI|nr:hypothetical protein Purlil1_170 [Purpureocillium lilacinum]